MNGKIEDRAEGFAVTTIPWPVDKFLDCKPHCVELPASVYFQPATCNLIPEKKREVVEPERYEVKTST